MQQAPIWHRAPFLRLVIPLLAGISLGENPISQIQSDSVKPLILFTTGVLILSLLFLQFSTIPLRYRPALLGGILLNSLLCTTGILLYHHQQITSKTNWFGHQLQNSIAITVSSDALPTPARKSLRFQLSVHAVINREARSLPATGKIIIYLPAGNPEILQTGSSYLIPASAIKAIHSPGNPGSFDYARFMQRKNILHQAYLKAGEIRLLKHPGGITISQLLARGQTSALSAMRQTVPPSARALAMALLIGYRDEVDKDLLQAYTNTGVVHVIAVSGMHLGLIFLLLQHLLLFPEHRFPFTKWIKAAIVLLITWWFSGIAGASPSIIRAAFMFSLIMLSRLLRKPMDPFQSLSLGAFSLLCYNPFWLWDAGFQLSFAALISIVVYQNLISSRLKPANKLVNAIWQLIAVTLAAQILTMPISIGQFHQAPVYFLFANLLAVPLSSIALITAIVQWILCFWRIPVTLPGKLTGLLINWMNDFIRRIDQLPGAVLDQLEWSNSQTWLAYGIITGATLWLVYKSRQAILLTMVSLLFFAVERLADHATKKSQHHLVVYHLPGKSAIEIMKGNTVIRVLTAFSVSQHPSLHAGARYFRVKNIRYTDTPLLRQHLQTIAIPENLQQSIRLLNAAPSLLVITRQVRSIKGLTGLIPPNCQVIIDGSVYESKAKQWEEELASAGIRCHNTWTSGAFLVSLKS